MGCESCGMPMTNPKDHGGGKEGNKYCKYCSDTSGKLKSREEVKEGWVKFSMNSEKISRKEAEKNVDEEMKQMPAWKK